MDILTPSEQEWLAQVEETAKEALDKRQLSVQKVADDLAISVRHLRRRLKKVTGIHPSEYLREMRLQRARHLLEKRAFRTVTEVAHATGFSTPEYFSKIYARRFGVLPSVVLQGAKKSSH